MPKELLVTHQALDLLRGVMVYLFGFEPEQIQPSVKLRDDLELDSLDTAELLTAIEELTGLRLMDRIWEAVDVAALTQMIVPAISSADHQEEQSAP